MTARQKCDQCGFLLSQCVCPWRPTLTTPLKLVILQDPKEAGHAKNTVTLLKLALAQIICINAFDDAAIDEFLDGIDPERWRLIFPAANSVAVETQNASQLATIEGVILIDATWRKAKKCYLSHQRLQTLTAWNFASAPMSDYSIRKSPDTKALSTLEACAYIVEQVTAQDMQVLREFMLSAQDWQWRHQPSTHRHLKGKEPYE